MNSLHHITAAILVGGAGTRLRSVVSTCPKAMAPVGGRPFLAYLLDGLVAQGLQKAVLCTGYLGEQLPAYFGHEYHGLELVYSRENQPLGTGGAIRHALPHLDSDSILLLNGDSYCAIDLAATLACHRERNARATVVLARVENGTRYGRVELQPDGRIARFCEKGAAPGPGWINAGVYWFDRSVIDQLPPQREISLERDVLAGWTGDGLFGFQQDGPFLDIGIPEDYARAERFLAEVHDLFPASTT